MNQGNKQSCFCEECKAACRYKPGWFLPGEAEEVAAHLKISLEELFETKLAVDWWIGTSEPDTFLLSPTVVSNGAGTEFPGNPQGTCIFFKEGLCEIHPVKPFECREMIHGEKDNSRHGQVADAWRTHQNQIAELLGREPESSNFGIGGLFNIFF